MTAWPDQRVTLFARSDSRRGRRAFGIRQADRRSHMYIIGKTGTGKSTLMEIIARSDIGNGQGAMLIDPHGDLVERLVSSFPERRRDDLIYFNVPDAAAKLGFNPLAGVAPDRRNLTASFMLDAFHKIWPDFWGPRLEHILRNALIALLDQSNATLADILRLFEDRFFRRHVAEHTAHPAVQRFWLEEYERYPPRMRAEAIAPIQNKVGAFLANSVLHRIVTRPSSFDLRNVMDEGRVLLVNLARGKLGDDATALLGSLLVSAVGLAALSRSDVPEDERRDFFVHLDEFQTFTTTAVAGMLAELRKYHVGMLLAHQHLAQLDPEVRASVLGNAGTIISFRVGPRDAKLLEREFAPDLHVEDLVGLPNRRIYLRLLINSAVSKPFSAEVLDWAEPN